MIKMYELVILSVICLCYTATGFHMNPKIITHGVIQSQSSSFSTHRMNTPAIMMSTVVKPKRKSDIKEKTKAPTKPETGFVVKESRSIADEIEAYFAEDNYLVILYNDPFNKRAYVSEVLQDVFSWDESQADVVMMQAHMNGFAVVLETSKERAEEYANKLLEKGLLAEARKSDGGGDGDGGGAPT